MPNSEGRYPDVDHVAKTGTCSLVRIAVDALLLAELLRVASEYAGDENKVLLHFGGKGKPLVLTTGNDEGQRFQAALMPLT